MTFRKQRSDLAAAVLATQALMLVAPAHAQISGAVTLTTDYRFRARSLSDGRPAATVTLAYDRHDGFYGDISAVAAVDPRAAAHFVSVGGDIGYSVSLPRDWSIDAGLTRAEFAGSAGSQRRGYSEVYVGATHGGLSARVRYSPDYFSLGNSTLYAECDAVIRPSPGWRIVSHVGSLHYRDQPRSIGIAQAQYDWRVALARRLGLVDVQLALTGGGPGQDFYRGAPRHRTALAGSATLPF